MSGVGAVSEAVIREMTSRDLGEVLAMERDIFPDPWPRIAFREHLEYNDSGGLVTIAGQFVIAYACYRYEYGDIHLTNLATDPAYRRKSVAKGLLAHILGMAGNRDCELIFLEVRASNRAARKFYEKAGFGIIDRSPGYYSSPVEDAIVMARRVAANPDDR